MITEHEMQERLFSAENKVADLERQLATYRRTAQENSGAACDALVMSDQLTESRGKVSVLTRQLAESQAREAAYRVALEKANYDLYPSAAIKALTIQVDDTALRQAIEAATSSLNSQLDLWKDAINDELVSCGIYSAAHEADPRKAIKDAIAWNVAVALDPLVSAEARKLVEAAKAEERDAVIKQLLALGALGDGTYIEAIRARSKP